METINFKSVEAINPINEPIAAFIALYKSFLWVNSPTSAPKKGPIMIPNGIGDKSPTTRPIIVPIMPALLPPNLLVPIAGMK